VLVEYLHYDKKYKRYERRRSKIHAHLPPCIEVSEGDLVRVVETRRLAKTVSHVVLGKLK
jgi:small subunit ribosomal protein S17